MSEYLSECLCVCEFDCLHVYLSVCLPDPDFTISSSLTLCAFLFLLLTSHLLVSSNTISLLSCSMLNHSCTNLFYNTLLTTSDHDTFFFFLFLSYLFETAFAVLKSNNLYFSSPYLYSYFYCVFDSMIYLELGSKNP